MGIRRKSRELIIQTFYALNYSEADPYLLYLDYINKYKEILNDLSADEDIPLDSNIYHHAEFSLKNLLPKIDEIDEILRKHLGDHKIEKIGVIDLIIMRLAVYEMFFENTPPPVMINEAVELAKKYCAEKSPSLINAILDKIREKEIGTNEKK